MKNILLLIVIFLLLSVLISGCEQRESTTPNGRKIKIGIIGPLSGPYLAQGKSGLEGIRAAIKVKPLLEDGTAVELVVEDDKDEAVRTIAALKKLTEVDKVTAVLVFPTAAQFWLWSPLLIAMKLPLWQFWPRIRISARKVNM